MWIRVTQLDIYRGLRGNPWMCPVARAVDRATGYRYGVAVGSTIGFTSLNGLRGALQPTPRRARDFISGFDQRLHVMPFSFQIKTPVLMVRW